MKKPTNIRDLMGAEKIAAIDAAPISGMGRHPTWYPIFSDAPNAVGFLINQSVKLIGMQDEGMSWLQDIIPRLADLADPEGAASALAELRAYGAMLEANFNVRPIPRSSKNKTPDFKIDCGDGSIVVEVVSKHQDVSQKSLIERVHCGENPFGVNRKIINSGSATVTWTEMVSTPGGDPDPNKLGDCVQANLISRVCAVKGAEAQIDSSSPALLWIDFANFGIWPSGLGSEQLEPLISGRDGLTSGALWYSHYGWKGAPIFEEDFDFRERIFRMGHEGRFRLQDKAKSRFSGSVLSLSSGLTATICLYENPWATCRLPDKSRRFLERLPWFDLHRSVCDWSTGDAEASVALKRREIEALFNWHKLLDESEEKATRF